MKLQIIVPHYKEPYSVMTPLFDSILIQQGIDFNDIGVIVVYDGPDATPLPELDELASTFPFDIICYHAPHGGVSAARNAGLEIAEAEYVMFCDADDCFLSVTSVYVILQNISRGFDTFTSMFYEEVPADDGIHFLSHEKDTTFVHGKVHRRQWLIDNDLRFDPDLTIHEDAYFHILVNAVADEHRKVYCPTPLYLWRWRDGSVCRRGKSFVLKTYDHFLKAQEHLVLQLLKRGYDKAARAVATYPVIDYYYAVNTGPGKSEELRPVMSRNTECVHDYFKRFERMWDETTKEEKLAQSFTARGRWLTYGLELESIDFDMYLKLIS